MKIQKVTLTIGDNTTPDGAVFLRGGRMQNGYWFGKPRLYRLGNGWNRLERIERAMSGKTPRKSTKVWSV